MSRLGERLIDLVVLFALLWFARDMRVSSPEIAGVIVAGAVQFWMQKNASAPHQPDPVVVAAAELAAVNATAAADAARLVAESTAAATAALLETAKTTAKNLNAPPAS